MSEKAELAGLPVSDRNPLEPLTPAAISLEAMRAVNRIIIRGMMRRYRLNEANSFGGRSPDEFAQ